jgi:hypothetical protein
VQRKQDELSERPRDEHSVAGKPVGESTEYSLSSALVDVVRASAAVPVVCSCIMARLALPNQPTNGLHPQDWWMFRSACRRFLLAALDYLEAPVAGCPGTRSEGDSALLVGSSEAQNLGQAPPGLLLSLSAAPSLHHAFPTSPGQRLLVVVGPHCIEPIFRGSFRFEDG